MRPPRASSLAAAAVALVAAAGFGGCGSDSSAPSAFDWLRPAPAPRSWDVARLRDRTALLAYPPSWHRARSDPGTVTAVVAKPSGGIAGYLNATPQQGAETFENWADFRVEHNGDEGDRRVTMEASAQHLPFRDGASGSCAIDRYVTESGHSYREIACLVGSPTATNVIVGAAPPSLWSRLGPQLERAISAFST